jgi:hypothetical protein
MIGDFGAILHKENINSLEFYVIFINLVRLSVKQFFYFAPCLEESDELIKE